MKPLSITKKITSRESESFKSYLRDVSNIPIFETSDDEHTCAMKAWKGDEKAKEELIRRNLRFVISCAKQYQINGASLEDLVNEGNIGIVKAAKKFDPTKGYKFISYAVWDIRKAILTFLSDNSGIIKLPTNKVSAVSKYKVRLDILEQILERPANSSDVLSAHSDYTSDDVKLLNELLSNDVTSLDMEVGDDGSSSPLYSLIPDPSMGRADELTSQSDLEINIRALISSLNEQETDIITRLYGLDGNTPETLSEVGDHYNVSRESIRQRRDKALGHIKFKVYCNGKQDRFNH